jgi:LysR family transcriptional activator of nhaA
MPSRNLAPPVLSAPSPGDWLNYHHLYYFWVIATEGGVSRAGKRLRLTHSTLSAQLKTLEQALGAELFERRGKRLFLTPLGVDVYHHASEIFRLGAEILDVTQGRAVSGGVLRVGAVSALPKTITYRLLEPAAERGLRLQVRQAALGALLEELAAGRLHLILSDAPPPQGSTFRVHVHMLGETDVLLYASHRLCSLYAPGFPGSLMNAPFLLPSVGTTLRKSIDDWFAAEGLSVHVVGEFEDNGVLRAFGEHGHGVFPVRAAMSTEVEEAQNARRLGALDGVRERYYAISLERKIRHPAVVAIVEQARSELDTRPPRKIRKPRRASAR